MLMEISTTDFGKTTRHMAMVSTVILMVQDMKETGKKTSSMERVLKHGLTVLVIKDTT